MHYDDGTLKFDLEWNKAKRVSCPITITDITEEKFWKKWIFFGLTYNQVTKQFFCIIQDSSVSTIDMKLMTDTSTSIQTSTAPTFSMGYDYTVFQMDDIVYAPRYFGVNEFQHVFDKSKL